MVGLKVGARSFCSYSKLYQQESSSNSYLKKPRLVYSLSVNKAKAALSAYTGISERPACY